MNAVIKKLLALRQNLSLMILNQSNVMEDKSEYVLVILPQSEQLDFLQLYTKDPARILEALAPAKYSESERWYPIAVAPSPTQGLNMLDKIVSESLTDLSMHRYASHIVVGMNKAARSNGVDKIFRYSQLLNFS